MLVLRSAAFLFLIVASIAFAEEEGERIPSDEEDYRRPFVFNDSRTLKRIFTRTPASDWTNPACPQRRPLGTMRVGLQKDYIPFRVESGLERYPGIDVEVAYRVACALNVSLEYRYASASALVNLVVAGEVDLSLGGLSSSAGRARLVNFSQPYVVTTPAGLLSRRALPPEPANADFPRKEFRTLRDVGRLDRLSIGVMAATTNADLVSTSGVFQKHDVVSFNDRKKLVEALVNREIDLLVADGTYIQALVAREANLLGSFKPLTGIFQEEHISMAVQKGDLEFLNYLNFFVKELNRTGELDRIVSVYLNSTKWVN